MKNLSSHVTKAINDIFRCKVCLKVTFTAFIAIIIVELIVLVPSCQKFVTDWKNNKGSQILSAVKSVVSLNKEASKNSLQFSNMISVIASIENIDGWSVLDKETHQAILNRSRSPSDLVFTEGGEEANIFSMEKYFDLTWRAEHIGASYGLSVRVESSELKSALNGYISRIAGLVVVISLFVTFTVMIALKVVIFSPILTLRKHLNAAKDNLQQAEKYLIADDCRGEVGDLYLGFNSLLMQIVKGFQIIKESNKSLKDEINNHLNTEKKLKKSKKVLSKLANFDDLTNLPNRRFALDRLAIEIDRSRAKNTIGALLFVDLDNFKEVNDMFGHGGGDELLQQAATRMVSAVRKSRHHVNDVTTDLISVDQSDLVARIGGDEFMVMLPDISLSAVEAIAERIQKTCAKPFLIQGAEAFSTTSVGISIFPRDSHVASECMSLSDIALYNAKEMGRNCYCFFSPSMLKGNTYRLKVSRQLHYALENDEFDLHYQPIIDLKLERATSVEVLLRWNNAELGPVGPDQFIPIAESTGLIVPIGDWVLEKAFEKCKQLNHLGNPIRVAINVSPKQFRNIHFVSRVAELLEKYEIPPELIELEITEGLLIEEQSEATENIKALSELGINFSIDDFGVGYSSLSYLSRFPVNTLKIDRSFVNEILLKEEDAPLIRTIIDMGKNFQLEIVAEGVETKEQVDFLLKHGCDKAQGYYFSMPTPFDEFFSALEDQTNTLMCLLAESKAENEKRIN